MTTLNKGLIESLPTSQEPRDELKDSNGKQIKLGDKLVNKSVFLWEVIEIETGDGKQLTCKTIDQFDTFTGELLSKRHIKFDNHVISPFFYWDWDKKSKEYKWLWMNKSSDFTLTK